MTENRSRSHDAGWHRRPGVGEGDTFSRYTVTFVPEGTDPSTLAAALTLVPPNDARPGDAYRFDVMQRDGKRIVGGSTYVLVVTKPDREE